MKQLGNLKAPYQGLPGPTTGGEWDCSSAIPYPPGGVCRGDHHGGWKGRAEGLFRFAGPEIPPPQRGQENSGERDSSNLGSQQGCKGPWGRLSGVGKTPIPGREQ